MQRLAPQTDNGTVLKRAANRGSNFRASALLHSSLITFAKECSHVIA